MGKGFDSGDSKQGQGNPENGGLNAAELWKTYDTKTASTGFDSKVKDPTSLDKSNADFEKMFTAAKNSDSPQPLRDMLTQNEKDTKAAQAHIASLTQRMQDHLSQV